MAFNTIHALKKKMHTLKTEKENASDRVSQLQQKLVESKTLYDKVSPPFVDATCHFCGSLDCVDCSWKRSLQSSIVTHYTVAMRVSAKTDVSN